MLNWIKSLKPFTDGKKTIAALLSLFLAASQGVDVSALVNLNLAAWGQIGTLMLLTALGLYGYEDAKARIRKELTK